MKLRKVIMIREAVIITAICAAASPLPSFARSLLYYYDFDNVENGGLVYEAANKGCGTATFTLKQNESPTIGYTSGALGSDYAFYSSNKSALWLGDGLGSIGCGTAQGFTISFWLKLNKSNVAWSNFFGFRLGGNDYRCEYGAKNTGESGFTLYYTEGGSSTAIVMTQEDKIAAGMAGDWHHFAIVFRPNSTNSTSTCSVYVDGTESQAQLIGGPGDLQQIQLGTWVRAGNRDRKTNANFTGIDEFAVFDYPATTEQVKWLAKFKPGQPNAGPGREMPIAWLFDAHTTDEGVLAVNSGTASDVAYKWRINEVASYSETETALKSASSFNLNNSTTFRVDNTSTATGLGATLGSGMSLSFWVKAPAKINLLWGDFMSFRIGDRYGRFEWNSNDPLRACIYGTGNNSDGTALPIENGEWHHVCMVWNESASCMEFYHDGMKAEMTWPLSSPMAAEALKSFTVGTRTFYENGSRRESRVTHGVYVDEVAIFNHSLSPTQVAWLAERIPCLPPLDVMNLERNLAVSGAWFGGIASWKVTDTTRTTIYPALEDTDVEAVLRVSEGVVITNDTFVTPKNLELAIATGDMLPVSATLRTTADSRFAPQSLVIADGLQLTVPLYAVNVGGTLTLGKNTKIIFDVTNFNNGGTTNAMTVGSFVLPDGETDVLEHFDVTDSAYTLSLSSDGKTIIVVAESIPVSAKWIGAKDAVLDSAANWECRNVFGAILSGALPNEHTAIVADGSTTFNVPEGTIIPWKYLRFEVGTLSGNVSLECDCDWRGLSDGVVTVADNATIDIKGNTLCLARGPLRGRMTITDTTETGGTLLFDVPEGAIVTNDYITLAGTLRLVKEGAGEFWAGKTGQSYSGGTEVREGRLITKASPTSRTFGVVASEICVSTNSTGKGIYEVNGYTHIYEHILVLAGGVMRNSGFDVDGDNAQLANVVLDADSTIEAKSSSGIINRGYTASKVDLGGHKLTLSIGSKKSFYMVNTEINDGIVDIISDGWFHIGQNRDNATINGQNVATDVTFRIGSALRLYAPLYVRDYEAIYPMNYNDGTAKLSVCGTFKPSEHDYFYGCTMQDGSTIDLSLRTKSLPLVSSFSNGRNTLEFEDGASVFVKLGDFRVKSREPVISWTSETMPKNISSIKFRSPSNEKVAFFKKADGLYVARGFIFIVR